MPMVDMIGFTDGRLFFNACIYLVIYNCKLRRDATTLYALAVYLYDLIVADSRLLQLVGRSLSAKDYQPKKPDSFPIKILL